jgi:hypothetical protein
MSYLVCSRSRRRIFLLVIPILSFFFTYRVEAAGPRLILVRGNTLSNPIVLTDWQENIDLIYAIAEEVPVQPGELDSRPYFDLAFFSGPFWVQYVDDGKPVDQLRSESGDQKGRFYPSVDGAVPIITYDVGLARRVAPEGIAILSRHGVPVHLPSTSGVTTWRTWLGVGVAIMCLSVTIAWLARKRRAGFRL